MTNILKEVNKYGYYEIRLESIGGLGANLCGKLLGELGAFQLGLYAQSFASYGSEKRGSPVKSHIRFSEKEILTNSIVKEPHVLCLFHENMLNKPTSLNGAGPHTTLIVNTASDGETIRKRLKYPVKEIVCIDASTLSNKLNARNNVILFGTIVKACGFIDLDMAKRIIEKSLGKKYPNSLKNNIAGVVAGYTECQTTILVNGENNKINYQHKEPAWGYENAPIGGINYVIGSSVSQDLSSSREGYIPLFLQEKCINCGLCDTTCPDYVFQFEEGEYRNKKMMINKGLDYHHCKGCLRCVEICPTEALVAGVEKDHHNLKTNLPNKDLLIKNLQYEISGASSYVTSESEDNMKNFKGGHL